MSGVKYYCQIKIMELSCMVAHTPVVLLNWRGIRREKDDLHVAVLASYILWMTLHYSWIGIWSGILCVGVCSTLKEAYAWFLLSSTLSFGLLAVLASYILWMTPALFMNRTMKRGILCIGLCSTLKEAYAWYLLSSTLSLVKVLDR